MKESFLKEVFYNAVKLNNMKQKMYLGMKISAYLMIFLWIQERWPVVQLAFLESVPPLESAFPIIKDKSIFINLLAMLLTYLFTIFLKQCLCQKVEDNTAKYRICVMIASLRDIFEYLFIFNYGLYAINTTILFSNSQRLNIYDNCVIFFSVMWLLFDVVDSIIDEERKIFDKEFFS